MDKIVLNEKDKRILFELDMDARVPLSVLGKRVGLSREVVYYRIRQLEKKGIIEGYYAAVDITKLGYIYCRVFLKYRMMRQEDEGKLLTYCKKSKCIRWIALGEGKWDITIVIIARNLQEIEGTYDDLSSKFGAFFQNPYTTIAFSIHHFKHNYLYGTEDETDKVLGGGESVGIDQTDSLVLGEISNNARIPIQELAKNLKINPKVASYRIKKLLQKKVILAFRAKLNLRLLGYDHYKVFLTLQNLNEDNQKTIHTYLLLNPNVIYITKPMGMHNLEFEIMVNGTNELHEFIREFRIKFADIVVDYDTMLNYAEPILEYVPK